MPYVPYVTTPHPLQPALDRSSRALLTATDLVEIAQTRKAANGRSDARQASLYRAIVTAGVGVVEEATEALATEALRAQGLQPRAMAIIQATVARLMQTLMTLSELPQGCSSKVPTLVGGEVSPARPGWGRGGR